jgi:tetratricopeptide (TPR) repeat protein
MRIFLILLVAVAGLGQSDNVSEIYATAKSALINDPRRAYQLLKQVVQLSPKHPQAWDDLGMIDLRAGAIAQARESFQKQIEVAPFHELAYQHLAFISLARGDVAEAEKQLRKQIEVNPLATDAHGMLGFSLLGQDRFAEAATEFDAATRIDPKVSRYWSGLARAQAAQGHETDALQAAQEAIDVAESPSIYRVDGAIWLARYGLATDKATQWAESGCADISARARLLDVSDPARMLREPGTYLPQCWLAMFEVLARSGHDAEALPYLKSAWRLSESREIGERLAEYLESKGRLAEAIKVYSQTASTNPHEGSSYKRLTRHFKTQAQIQSAIRSGRTSMELMRTVTFAARKGFKGSGRVQIAVRPDGTAAQFVLMQDEGNLRSRIDALKAEFKDEGFTSAWPALYPRIGYIHCSEVTKECMIVFMTVNQFGLN